MKKILVFSVIFMITLACMSTIIYATGDDSTVYGSSASAAPATPVDYSASFSSSAAISQPSLDLSNILNIILVVLGILMVLFAIAILVRIR